MSDGTGAPGLPRSLSLPCGTDPRDAATLIAAFAAEGRTALLLVFASPLERLEPLSTRLRGLLPATCRIAGCSSAGELTPAGYSDDGIVAVAFPADGYAAEVVRLPVLSAAEVTRWMTDLRAGAGRLARRAKRQMLGLVLADGASRHEDLLAATLDAALPGVPVIGGMAGNGVGFGEVAVMEGGRVTADAAVVCLLATDLPAEEVVFAHFAATPERCVVTAADETGHAILELNAEPAAQEYARMAGLDPDRLTTVDFARHPLLLRMGRRHHVRAVSGIRSDGGLQMLAAIDVGTVLTLGRAEDLLAGFEDALDRLPRRPALVLGFDCILRRLALEQAGLGPEVARLHARHNIRGFNTYGELHEGMHVNQTFVGMAFLPPPGSAP